MPTRIPKEEDFEELSSSLKFTLTYPEVRETTTAILLIFHGLGDSERAFTTFAQSVNLPGVLGISVRGVSPLPPALLGLPEGSAPLNNHFHWGDDLTISDATGQLDLDPGFTKAMDRVLGRLVRDVLVTRCGWDTRDILLFGFGQGGSVALGLASKLRDAAKVTDASSASTPAEEGSMTAFKGAVTIGGPLPASTIPTVSARDKARTPVLVCRGRGSESDLDADALDVLRDEFADVRDVQWQKPDDGMPASREEMLPIMKFFAERLAATGFEG